MRRKRSTADTASARAPQTTYEPNQWRELVKVALLASAFIGAYATGAALSPVEPPTEPTTAPPPPLRGRLPSKTRLGQSPYRAKHVAAAPRMEQQYHRQ